MYGLLMRDEWVAKFETKVLFTFNLVRWRSRSNSYIVDNQIITISTASITELCMVYENLKRKESISTLSVISDSERDKLMGKNKYGPNNPYNN